MSCLHYYFYSLSCLAMTQIIRPSREGTHPPTSAKWCVESSTPLGTYPYIHCVACLQNTLYKDGADLTTVLVHNCQSNIHATSPPQGHRGSTSVAVCIALSEALSVATSVAIVVATSVATQCGFMHGGVHSVGEV